MPHNSAADKTAASLEQPGDVTDVTQAQKIKSAQAENLYKENRR
jgi:hypothetical protein